MGQLAKLPMALLSPMAWLSHLTTQHLSWLNPTAINSRPLILKLPAASHIDEYGPRLAQIIRMEFASMMKVLSGTPMLETSIAYAFGKGERCSKQLSWIVDASLVCSAELIAGRCSW